MPGGTSELKSRFRSESEFGKLRYLAEDSKFTMRNVALAAELAALLYPLFAILDYFIYPEFFQLFLVIRLVCAAFILLVGHLATKPWARRYYRLFATLVPLISALFICVMIVLVRDPGTPYYAGLNLCIVGTGTLFQWTSREATITSVVVFLMYLLSVLPHFFTLPDKSTLSLFGGNCLFIVSTAFLVIVAAYNHHNFRYEEFVTRSKLRMNQAAMEEKNQQLTDALATLRETEKQLYQSDKMSFLGQLSAGVIHEIGNPLNYTNQALYILRSRLSSGGKSEDTLEVIEDIQDGIDRILGIIGDLREFTHRGQTDGQTFLLEDSIGSALRILQKPIEEAGVTLNQSIEPGIEIAGLKNQVTQVLSNLIHNAVQAMGKQSGDKLLGIAARTDDAEIVIEISDSGEGISEEDLKSIFDPFFTTKDPGEGTGLGLSISYRIIEAHGGSIEVESTPGEGTTFFLHFPSVG